jgi:hypothetical protein
MRGNRYEVQSGTASNLAVRRGSGKVRLKSGGAELGDILFGPIDRGTDEYSHDPRSAALRAGSRLRSG